MFILLSVFLALLVFYWFFMSPWSQTFGHFPFIVPSRTKQIALTFDDGPNEPYTTDIATYLHKKGIRATFFLVGKNLKRYPNVATRLLKLGHVIGTHTVSHRLGAHLIKNGYEREIYPVQQLIFTQTGKYPILFRPPWLFRTPSFLRDMKKRGITVAAGDFCHPMEVGGASAGSIARFAIAQAQPGIALIFHDGAKADVASRAETTRAIPLVVEGLRAQGYAFTTVDALLGVEAYGTFPQK